MTTERLARLVLRSAAILVAVAAAIDPVWTIARPPPQSVTVARLASSDITATEAAVRAALTGTEIAVRSASHGRLPCRPGEACLMVADGSVDVEIPNDLTGPVSLVSIATPSGPNVAVRSVAASRTLLGAGSGTVRLTMAGTGMPGRNTKLRVTDGGATVGAAVHEWKTDGAATVDVAWWPLGEGPRALTVAAVPFEGEASLLDNAVDLGVTVSSGRVPVLAFDARPSWASTFVRRALEDDPRFQVEHRVALGPSLAAGTAGGRLDTRTLDAAAVVIVGSPEAVSARDVTLLERFVRVRGGTLVLVPDRAPAGASARLFSGQWSEHLEALPSLVGELRASETLRLSTASPFDVVLGAVKEKPAIVLSPAANGRIVVSGAMDAWRYRDSDGGAFDRFWRSLVLETAATSTSLQVEFAHPVAAPGAEVPFVVRHLQMEPAAESNVSATANCGAGPARTIRLWPDGRPGTFLGRLQVDGREACEMRVAVEGGPSAVGGIAVTSGATQTTADVMAKLERAATRSGGVIVRTGEHDKLVAALAKVSPPVPAVIHPMRSPWWMFPFVAGLGVEWWLRRRSGLR